MADHSGKPQYKSTNTRRVRLESCTPRWRYISEVGMYTAPILLKESDIPSASIVWRKPEQLEKADLLFSQWFKWHICESTAHKTAVCSYWTRRSFRSYKQGLKLNWFSLICTAPQSQHTGHSSHCEIYDYVRLVFTSDGVGVVVGVIRELMT